MSAFANAVAELAVAVSSPVATRDSVKRAVQDLLNRIPMKRDQLDDGLARMADVLASCPLEHVGIIGIACGAVVENGGSPLLALDAALDRLLEVLPGVKEFVDACHRKADASQQSEDNRDDPIVEFGTQVREANSQGANCYDALDWLSRGAIAMMSRSKEARRKARLRSDVLRSSQSADNAFRGASSFLTKMLQVLDDEPVLVIHPGEHKGYQVRMSGIGVNFELFILLADVLIGDPAKGWLSGEKPDPAVAASCRDKPATEDMYATGAFNLFNWQGLQKDLTVPLGHGSGTHEHWIWMEGVPQDISPFDGLRVILLGPPPYLRSIPAGRIFSNMPADLTVERQLSTDESHDWLKRIAAADR